MVVSVAGSIASLKVAVMLFPTATPVALLVGEVAVTVGGVVSVGGVAVVNDHRSAGVTAEVP